MLIINCKLLIVNLCQRFPGGVRPKDLLNCGCCRGNPCGCPAQNTAVVVGGNQLGLLEDEKRPQGHAPIGDQTIYWVTFEILSSCKPLLLLNLNEIMNN